MTQEETGRADIEKVEVVSAHSSPRGPSKYARVPPLGVLANGEPYAVYRFVLYADAFRLHVGLKASAEGTYIQPLELTADMRNSSSSVRVVSVLPTGASIRDILIRLSEDLEHGASIGHYTVDANGVRRRVFLDLVAISGDTPGIDALLDVKHHSADACCHKCNFEAYTESKLVNGYLRSGVSWSVSACRRTLTRHAAARLMRVPEGVLRHIGISASCQHVRRSSRCVHFGKSS